MYLTARKVLEKTEHILIVENGAQKFALANGIPILPPGSLNVPESLTTFMESFESVTCCTNAEQYENEWEDDTKTEKKICDSDCVINRSIDGEYPYCVLSSDSVAWDEPLILQVYFPR